MAIRRPRMVPWLVRAAWAFRARDWYRRPPFLPLPPRSYLRWRLDTAYGDPDAQPPIDEFSIWTAKRLEEQQEARTKQQLVLVSPDGTGQLVDGARPRRVASPTPASATGPPRTVRPGASRSKRKPTAHGARRPTTTTLWVRPTGP